MAQEKVLDRSLPGEQALWMLRKMIEIRRVEERIIEIYPSDQMVTPVHLHIGQEAVAAGLCANLTAKDTIFFTHRTHAPALAKGMDLRKFMAELYGRTTGCARGFGGSMHLVDPSHGMLGSSAVVGGGIALGVGSALAAKLAGEDRVSVSFFGDAACDSGVFWESMNFAALRRLPVLLVCEDNNLSNTMRYDEHMFADLTAVAGNFMPSATVDGTDAVEVFVQARHLLRYVRSEKAPAFMRCRTKRWMRHQGIEPEDLDYNRSDPEVDCPILKLKRAVLERGLATEADITGFYQQADDRIEDAIAFAAASPFPEASELLEEV